MDENDPRDTLFKGCTRPAMLFGVPVVPLVIAIGIVVLISVWTRFMLLVFSLGPIILLMREIVKKDDQQFRLLGLKFMFRVVHRDKNRNFWKASAYSPIAFTKRK